MLCGLGLGMWWCACCCCCRWWRCWCCSCLQPLLHLVCFEFWLKMRRFCCSRRCSVTWFNSCCILSDWAMAWLLSLGIKQLLERWLLVNILLGWCWQVCLDLVWSYVPTPCCLFFPLLHSRPWGWACMTKLRMRDLIINQGWTARSRAWCVHVCWNAAAERMSFNLFRFDVWKRFSFMAGMGCLQQKHNICESLPPAECVQQIKYINYLPGSVWLGCDPGQYSFVCSHQI